jgi:hypothetical protein
MLPAADPPVADDFAAIAKRLREVQREAALEIAASERQRQLNNQSPDEKDDMSSCA